MNKITIAAIVIAILALIMLMVSKPQGIFGDEIIVGNPETVWDMNHI